MGSMNRGDVIPVTVAVLTDIPSLLTVESSRLGSSFVTFPRHFGIDRSFAI
jgi:hypothetical protein